MEIGRVGRRMTNLALLGSDAGALWTKRFSLELHGITEGLLILRLGHTQGGGCKWGRRDLFPLYSSGRLLNL